LGDVDDKFDHRWVLSKLHSSTLLQEQDSVPFCKHGKEKKETNKRRKERKVKSNERNQRERAELGDLTIEILGTGDHIHAVWAVARIREVFAFVKKDKKINPLKKLKK